MPPLPGLGEKAQNFEIKNESEFNIAHPMDNKRVTKKYYEKLYFYKQDIMNLKLSEFCIKKCLKFVYVKRDRVSVYLLEYLNENSILKKKYVKITSFLSSTKYLKEE